MSDELTPVRIRAMRAAAKIRIGGPGDSTARDVLELVDALEAERAEVERLRRWKAEALQVLAGWETVWEAQFPCDGGCNYNTGPEEQCTRHGRSASELWAAVDEIRAQRDELRAERDRWKAFGEGVLNLVRRSQNDPHFAVVNIDAAGYVGSVIRASDILALANEHKLLND